MEVVTVHKAKTELSKLLKRVEAGEEFIIARGRKPIARLTRVSPEESVAIQKREIESSLQTNKSTR